MTYDTEKIKRIDIVDWMEKHGYRRGKGNSGKWRSFYSPFNSESNASFKVDVGANKWVDFSAGITRKKSIIDLVMMIENVEFKQACEILEGNKNIDVIQHEPKPTVSGVKIHDNRKLTNKELISYMCDVRKINIDVLLTYCTEIDFSFPLGKNPDAIYTGVGFKNDLGGYEIRNSWQKIATSPKMFSTINGKTNDSSERILFEAFVDFLSYLTHHNIVIPPKKTIVLNGTGMINILKPFLDNKDVYCYLDSDRAGDSTMEKLDNCNVIDCRSEFGFHSDYNEYLQNI